MEFALCRYCQLHKRDRACKQSILRSTSFLVYVSGDLLSCISCTTCRRSSSVRRCRLSASFSISTYILSQSCSLLMILKDEATHPSISPLLLLRRLVALLLDSVLHRTRFCQSCGKRWLGVLKGLHDSTELVS